MAASFTSTAKLVDQRRKRGPTAVLPEDSSETPILPSERPPGDGSCPLLDLPADVLRYILSYIPRWQRRIVRGSSTYQLNATCRKFNRLLDDTIEHLAVHNHSAHLTLNALCAKLGRCQSRLKSLHLDAIFVTTPEAYCMLRTAIQNCQKLDTLCSSLMTAAPGVLMELTDFPRIKWFWFIPFTGVTSIFGICDIRLVYAERQGHIFVAQRSLRPQVIHDYWVIRHQISADHLISATPHRDGQLLPMFHVQNRNDGQHVLIPDEILGNILPVEKRSDITRFYSVPCNPPAIPLIGNRPALLHNILLGSYPEIAITEEFPDLDIFRDLNVESGHEIVVWVPPWRLRWAQKNRKEGMLIASTFGMQGGLGNTYSDGGPSAMELYGKDE